MNRDEQQFLVFKYLIDKMLKPYKVGFDYITNTPTIDGVEWNSHYTWTNEQRHKFALDAVSYIQEVLHLSKRQASLSVGKFLSNHGLKVVNQ